MPKIKVVYDWFNDKELLIANDNDSLLPEMYEYTLLKHTHWKFSPIRTTILFNNPDIFEFVPIWTLKKGDYFIYEFTIRTKIDDKIFCNGEGLYEYLSHNININENILDDIRYNNGYFLIEWITESNLSPVFTINTMQFISKKFNIPSNKIIYIVGSANAKQVYNNQCNQLRINDRILISNFEWFEYEASISLQKLESLLPAEKKFENINKTFLCYNNKYRPWRSEIFAIFYKLDLFKNSYISMNDSCKYYNGTWEQNWHDFSGSTINTSTLSGRSEVMNHFNITYEDISFLNKSLPFVIDNTKTEKEKIQIINAEPNLSYQSLISVITETNFFQPDIFFTEKTWKPIANKQPFIMMGPYKSLEYLRRLGYKTFNDFFDESYDQEYEPGNRMIMIGELCKQIDSWTIEKKKEFFEASHDIVNHNFNLLKSRCNNKISNILKDLI